MSEATSPVQKDPLDDAGAIRTPAGDGTDGNGDPAANPDTLAPSMTLRIKPDRRQASVAVPPELERRAPA